jgi:hypothetical protein
MLQRIDQRREKLDGNNILVQPQRLKNDWTFSHFHAGWCWNMPKYQLNPST